MVKDPVVQDGQVLLPLVILILFFFFLFRTRGHGEMYISWVHLVYLSDYSEMLREMLVYLFRTCPRTV